MIGRAGRAARAAAASAMLALLAAGCVQMPERGPVHETDTSADTSVDEVSSIDAVPPRPNAQPAEIAKGFIDAMSAWPIETGIARQFLSEEAAAAWKPDEGTITFADALPPEYDGQVTTVQLSGAEHLDRSGAWQGEMSDAEETLSFEMTLEDGEYRITNPPDALVVPARWFAERFRQVSLYFFDRTGQILVPEPVFVPRGDQLASTLIKRLVDGPRGELGRISRTYLPSSLDPGLSVPVTDQGVAEVQFGESVGAPRADDEDLEKMLAQLGWTLRQVPGISALRVSIGGRPVPSGDTEYDVNRGQEYDPAGADANPLLYGLRGGRLVYGEADTLAPADGPLGAERHDVRSVALRLDASIAAAVSSDGDEVYLAQVRGARSDRVRTLARGSSDLLPPAWDFTDRLWLVDHAAKGARVRYREGAGALQTLRVPGVSGRKVRAFLVSRDATRFVALVRGPEGDEVRAGRILVDGQGQVESAWRTRGIPIEGGDQSRISDLAWTSPTSIAVLRPVSDERFEVSTVAVDGAPTVAEPLSTTVSEHVVALAAAPGGSTPYAVTRDGLIDLETLATVPFSDGRVNSIGYVG